jgi:CheY-like chemotaxis protein
MPKGGKVVIETANVILDEAYARLHVPVVPGHYVMMAVSDNGEGMDTKTLGQVFEPFFTTKDRATGLGLATVYGIVNQSGGHIWAYSEPGRGTTFKIYLPRVDAVLDDPSAAYVSQGEFPGGSETVLLVEDSNPLRALAREFLEKGGYAVLEAPDGIEAADVAQGFEAPIHLLLTDVVMPGMSGHDVAERLKLSHPEAAVLYMSGYTDDAIVHHGVLDEGVMLLAKPFTRDSLMRKVREQLDANRAATVV